MASLGLGTLGRLAFRGGRALGRAIYRQAVNRAAGKVVGSVGGLVQSAARRRRRARAWAYMKNYRRSAALGLGKTRYLSSCKYPLSNIYFPATNAMSRTFRIGPMSGLSSGSGSLQGTPSLWQSDSRFTAMCGLYKQFRIVSMYVNVIGDTTMFQSWGTMGIFARVIRNYTNATPGTTFLSYDHSGNVYCMDVPGVIWRRTYDSDKKIVFSVSIRPKSGLEKMQWYSTDYNAYLNGSDFVNGVATDFCPCVDVGVYRRHPIENGVNFPLEIWVRYVIEFRDAMDNSDASSKTVEVETTAKNLQIMENAVKAARVSEPSVLEGDKSVVFDG